MMPGITNLPARLIFSAPAGIRICDAGPTQPIRPLSTIIETCIAGGRPVPSIRVKSSSTLTSPKSAPADHKSRTRASIPPQLYINNMHASVARGHALRKTFDSEWGSLSSCAPVANRRSELFVRFTNMAAAGSSIYVQMSTSIAGGSPVPSIRAKFSSPLTWPKSEPADHKSRTRASIPPQLYINNMHASVAPGHALRKAFDSEWAACQAARRFLTGAPNYLYDSLIWLLPVRRFTANFGRGGIPRAESYAFFDHVNHVFCITGIQEKHVVGFDGSEDFASRSHHPRIGDRSALDAEGERHVSRTPLGERKPRNFQIFFYVGQCVLVFLFYSQQQFAVGIERPCVSPGFVLSRRNPPDLSRRRRPVNTTAAVL